jgi:nucleotide-binding universal stress UspA family protein
MYRHILIPTDGSKTADHGTAHGLALAKSIGAKVSVIFVVEPFSEMSGRFLEVVARYAELRKEQAISVLDDAAKAAAEAGVSCETIKVENEQPDQAIIAAAGEKGCDLIVMSTHGRGGLSKFLLGSVTNKVLTQAKIPVLVCQ